MINLFKLNMLDTSVDVAVLLKGGPSEIREFVPEVKSLNGK